MPGLAVVTGAASGLGAGIADHLSGLGWRVAGWDLNPSACELSLQVDVADRTAVARALKETIDALGEPNALVTAAGIYEMVPAGDIDDAQWERMLRVNLIGTVQVCAAVVPGMVRRGSGSVVTISSDLGVGGSDGDAHYATTKGAIVGFTRGLTVELRGTGVSANSVAPGAADTPMIGSDSPWRAAAFLTTLPLDRLVRPDEIAAAVAFLLEHGSQFRGVVLSPNCGATI
jgi:2-hydroxycyclohexanecarboxyl-CoA dehydrogenase